MLFKDIIGQKEVKQKLVEMVQHNRLSHALLFLGKEGSGALSLAMAFSQYVSLLPNKNQTPEASLFGEVVETKLPSSPDDADAWMQKQSSLSKAEQLVHPDIHFSYPVIIKKPGTPPVSADYAAEWREFVQQFP
jgi:DNA polymerase III subunit delta'